MPLVVAVFSLEKKELEAWPLAGTNLVSSGAAATFSLVLIGTVELPRDADVLLRGSAERHMVRLAGSVLEKCVVLPLLKTESEEECRRSVEENSLDGSRAALRLSKLEYCM